MLIAAFFILGFDLGRLAGFIGCTLLFAMAAHDWYRARTIRRRVVAACDKALAELEVLQAQLHRPKEANDE